MSEGKRSSDTAGEGWYNVRATWTPYRKQLPPALRPFPQMVEMTWTPRKSVDEIYLYGETLIPDDTGTYHGVKCELKDEDLLHAACIPGTSVIVGMWENKEMMLAGSEVMLKRWVLVQPFQVAASPADRRAFLAEMLTAMSHPLWGATMTAQYESMSRVLS